MSITASELIYKSTKGKLSATASFYGGRGNNPGDLNSDILEMLYDGVKMHVGAKAAKDFVELVATMTDDASATTFLVAFHRFAQNGWTFSQQVGPKNSNEAFAEAIADTHRKDPDAALGAFAAAMFGGGNKQPSPGEGLMIIGNFLTNHGKKLPKTSRAFVDYTGASRYRP